VQHPSNCNKSQSKTQKMKKYIATWNNEQREIWAETLTIAKNMAQWIKCSNAIKGKTIVKLKKQIT
jgi:hypothetical protein